MARVCLLLGLFGAASGLLLSPPALPRAGCAMRHSPLCMQEDPEQTTQTTAPEQTTESEQTVGISSALGGGKKSADVEKNPIAVAGSLGAFIIVSGALVWGALNQDALDEYVANNAKCVEGKIVKGVKIKCNPDGSFIR
eukprot:CAMPEP_0119058182 /NCGR_PEP_ID=MMETSP1178-20130426/2549_1 /TAXON_ID=33656 /ORGANISM="unid sp, Strain CCMP2000" /LENGTH=138 /DNA_ID=CAMNT_0007039091 /DNA_START=30 /DNA_END=446 /DNA_ORIENTATION=-